MSQEINFAAIAEKVVAGITNESVKNHLITHSDAKLFNAKRKNLEETAAELAREEDNYKDVMEAVINKEKHNGFIAQVRAKCSALMDDLNSTMAGINVLERDINARTIALTNDRMQMEHKVSKLQDIYAAHRASVLAAEDKARLKVEASRKKMRLVDSQMKLRNDSLTKMKEILASENALLETLRKHIKKQEAIKAMKTRDRYNQRTLIAKSKKEAINRKLQRERVVIRDMRVFSKYLASEITRIEASIAEEENACQFNGLFALSSGDFLRSNKFHFMTLYKLVNVGEQIQWCLAKTKKKCSELKNMMNGVMSKIYAHEAKSAIIEKEMKTVSATANAANYEIQTLKAQIESLDDSIQQLNVLIGEHEPMDDE